MVADEVPPELMGDRYWLRQIVLNLVNNAIKFTDEGEVALQIFRQNGRYAFQVSDTGVGIPEEAQHRIFEAFEQVNNTYVGSVEGAGLGMTTLMGGEIFLESVEGEGSTFTIELPLAEVKAEEVVV